MSNGPPPLVVQSRYTAGNGDGTTQRPHEGGPSYLNSAAQWYDRSARNADYQGQAVQHQVPILPSPTFRAVGQPQQGGSPASHNPRRERRRSSATTNHQRNSTELNQEFKKRQHPKRFFVVGRVFSAMWSESTQDGEDSRSRQSLSVNTYGEPVFTKARRFVVVRGGELTATAIPITTYGLQGLMKEGICVEEHGVIRSEKQAAPLLDIPEGRRIQPITIMVDKDAPQTKLDDLSRLNYGTPYTIHHYTKVKPIGMVNKGFLNALLTQFHNVSLFPDKGLGMPSLPLASAHENTVTDREILDLMAKAVHDLARLGWPYETAFLAVQGSKVPTPSLAWRLAALRITTDRQPTQEADAG